MTDNEFWKSLGICTRCHKRKAEPGKTQCLECNEKGYQRYRTVGMTDEQKKERLKTKRCAIGSAKKTVFALSVNGKLKTRNIAGAQDVWQRKENMMKISDRIYQDLSMYLMDVAGYAESRYTKVINCAKIAIKGNLQLRKSCITIRTR